MTAYARAVVAAAGICAAACTPAAQQRAVVEGQLFCAVLTEAGPVVLAVESAEFGVGVSVIGLQRATVAAICAAIDGVPVVPPADPAAAPVVAVDLPPP